MSRIRTIALASLVAIVAVAAGILLSRAMLMRSDAPALAKATLLEPARPLPALAFTDHEGKPFSNDRLRGHWNILFFGFTSCPDVCPMTLAVLAQVEKQLADLPEQLRPRVILVSVDAQRDTPQQLARYVHSFSPTFVGITASSQSEVEKFARGLGVPVAITQLSDGNYTVDHSAAIFVVDPNGSLRALSSTPHSAQIIAEDYRRIVGSAH